MRKSVRFQQKDPEFFLIYREKLAFCFSVMLYCFHITLLRQRNRAAVSW